MIGLQVPGAIHSNTPCRMETAAALGCAILHEPSVLFLDEPTSGVDQSHEEVLGLIQEMGERGVTTFVTTHYMDEAEYCGRLALIYQGKIVALGRLPT